MTVNGPTENMKITKVCCQGCGAALDIEESLRFVTCNYCHARLEVVHDSTVTHTRLLEKLERRTERLVDDVKVLQLQNDLDRLEREWDRYREASLIRGEDGAVSEPSVVGSVVGGILGIAGGLSFMVFAGSFGLVGLIFVGFGIYVIVSGSSKAAAFKEFRESYEARRSNLIIQIDQSRRGESVRSGSWDQLDG